jgi:hypothetical protein
VSDPSPEPVGQGPPAQPDPPERSDRVGADNDAARRRVTRRLLLAGATLALLAAVATGLAGASGRAGFAVFSLVLALTTAVAGLWATATLLYDDLKKRRPSRRRAIGAVGLFATTAVLMAVVAGVGG